MTIESTIYSFLTTDMGPGASWPQEVSVRTELGASGPVIVPVVFQQSIRKLREIGSSQREGSGYLQPYGNYLCQLCTFRMVTLIRSFAYKDMITSQNVASHLLVALNDANNLAERSLAALICASEATENEQMRVMSRYEPQARIQYNQRHTKPTILTSSIVQTLISHFSTDRKIMQILCALTLSVHDRDRALSYQLPARALLSEHIASTPELQGYAFSTLNDETMFLSINAISAWSSSIIALVAQTAQQ